MFIIYNSVILPIHSFQLVKEIPKKTGRYFLSEGDYILTSISVPDFTRCAVYLNTKLLDPRKDYTVTSDKIVFNIELPNHPIIEITTAGYVLGLSQKLIEALSPFLCSMKVD